MLLVMFGAALAMSGADGTTTTGQAKAPPKKICKTIEQTGSRMGGIRICKSSEDWEREREEARKQIGDRQGKLLDNATIGGVTPPQ